MATVERIRHITPSPTGVLTWLGQPKGSIERRLFEHILLAGRPLAVETPALAEALALPMEATGRALFALNRHQSLSVSEEFPVDRESWAETGLARLVDDLVTLATPGQKLLLASADGLCIARAGWSRYEAEVMAARPPEDHRRNLGEIMPLHFASHSFHLSSNARLDLRNPALLRLGYRLLKACGRLGAEESSPC